MTGRDERLRRLVVHHQMTDRRYAVAAVPWPMLSTTVATWSRTASTTCSASEAIAQSGRRRSRPFPDVRDEVRAPGSRVPTPADAAAGYRRTVLGKALEVCDDRPVARERAEAVLERPIRRGGHRLVHAERRRELRGPPQRLGLPDRRRNGFRPPPRQIRQAPRSASRSSTATIPSCGTERTATRASSPERSACRAGAGLGSGRGVQHLVGDGDGAAEDVQQIGLHAAQVGADRGRQSIRERDVSQPRYTGTSSRSAARIHVAIRVSATAR